MLTRKGEPLPAVRPSRAAVVVPVQNHMHHSTGVGVWIGIQGVEEVGKGGLRRLLERAEVTSDHGSVSGDMSALSLDGYLVIAL
jgi:hypothetical protein